VIIGTLSNIKKDMEFYPFAVQKSLNFLLKEDLNSLSLGRHVIDDDKIYANVAEYQTQPKSQRRPERHEKYVDIQCIVKGTEKIGVGLLENAGQVAEDCLKERDVIFYKSMENETDMILNAGMFAIYFPWDVHRPNCNGSDECNGVRKVVVKISVDML
jgi:biofilm protein TabA